MEKHILQEIKRTAQANGRPPLGWRKSAQETGVRDRDWLGKYWAGWGGAAREAGQAPNQITETYDETDLLEKFILVARKIKKLSTDKDLRLKAYRNPDFPDAATKDESSCEVWNR